jgi:hypothetical protein
MTEKAELIAELERLIQIHQQAAEEAEAGWREQAGHARKYRAALRALTAPAPAPKARGRWGSTSGIIRSQLSQNHAMKPAQLVESMLEAGWTPKTSYPAQTVYVTLSRLKKEGEVIRNADGTYSLPPSDQ